MAPAPRVVHWYPAYFSGDSIAHSVRSLALAQRALGAQVAIVAAARTGRALYAETRGADGLQQIEWQPALRLRLRGSRLRLPGRALRAQLAAFGPHVVHAHAEFNPDNLWLPWLHRGPLVLSPRGAFHPAVLHKNHPRLRALYLRLANQLLYRKLAAVHAISPREQERIRSVLPGAPTHCIVQGCHAQAARTAPPAAPPGRPLQLLFLGRFDVYHKGLDLLLEAVALARRELGPRLGALRLVGPDWRGGRARLTAQAQALGIADCVHFEPAVPLSQIAAVHAGADLFLHPSRYEAFGKSALEALLAGLPCILSEEIGAASYPEIAALPHVRIVPCEPPALARAIAACSEQLDKLRSAARDAAPFVESFFSWSRAARETLALYEALRAAG